MAFNDCAGRGRALRYRTGNTTHRWMRLDLFWEPPMSLADMHQPQDDEMSVVDMVINHMETAREAGGLAVVNWHVGRSASHSAWYAAFEAARAYFSQAEDAWVATPREISRWWLKGGVSEVGMSQVASRRAV